MILAKKEKKYTAEFTALSPIPPFSKEQSKIGSFQLFVKNKGPVENYSWDLFAVDEVHKIGILDLRILNLDRNNCNILVAQSAPGETLTLVPIDHGFSIPDTLSVCSYELESCRAAPPCTPASPTASPRRSPRSRQPLWRSRSLRPRSASTPCGSAAPSFRRSPPSSRCGSPSRSMTSRAPRSSTASASRLAAYHWRSQVLAGRAYRLFCPLSSNNYDLDTIVPSTRALRDVRNTHVSVPTMAL